MNHRSTASFGKGQEYIAIAELLKRGLDVYTPLVDDQQIDCVVRKAKVKSKPEYLDVQIKARSEEVKYACSFASVKLTNPRPNYWLLFYSEGAKAYWVIPSQKLARLGNKAKSGKNKGTYSVTLANKSKGGWKSKPKFRKYENAFELLK